MRKTATLFTTLLLIVGLVSGCKSSSQAGGGGGSAPATSGTTTTAAGSATVDASGGNCPTSNTIKFAKSKFVLHVGLAAGTFHRYIYKPFKAGTFKSGAHGRVRAILKGGVTALFDAHEIKKAVEDVKANPTLCKVLITPLTSLESAFGGLKSKLTHGDTSGLEDVNSAISSVESASSGGGAAITESTDESQG